MGLPDFLIIGAQKSATTSLASALREHPDIYVPKLKELHFFDNCHLYKRFGMDGYRKFFQAARSNQKSGEASTSYSAHARADVAERIARDLPSVKLIYIVRNPAKRAVSAWRHYLTQGPTYVPADFVQALISVPVLSTAGLYYKNYLIYRKHFDRDRILVLFFEDLLTDAETELRRCYEFIGVDPEAGLKQVPRENAGKRSIYLPPEVFRKFFARRIGDGANPNLPSFRPRLGYRSISDPLKDPEARRVCRERFGDDAGNFLREYGKPAGFWPL